MATVLLVEDEDTLRDSVASYLEIKGHSVLKAESGREAFDLGVSASPEVLVADWMLRNHIHGLHVAQTLRVVDPALHTVLITGFPSKDLESEFESGGVLRMLEKPFDLSELERAIRDAAEARIEPTNPVGAVVLEVGRDGALEFVSPRAQHIFNALLEGAAPASIDAVLGADFAAKLDSALEFWTEMSPDGSQPATWKVRTRSIREGRSWLVVICLEDESRWQVDPRVRILLDHHSRSAPLLPELGPVIVFERDGAVRRLLASQIERIGALCYLADDLNAAVRLLIAEPRAATILVDIETAGPELEAWISALRDVRVDARVIGTGGEGDVGSLRARGLDAVLHKPWRIDELVASLSS